MHEELLQQVHIGAHRLAVPPSPIVALTSRSLLCQCEPFQAAADAKGGEVWFLQAGSSDL